MPSESKIPKRPYYVTMTDKGMSGWGGARGKTSKLVIGCENYAQAYRVKHNIKKVSKEMIYVNITTNKPYYSPKKFRVSYKSFSQVPLWNK
jgi:hypothetical protein